MTGLSMVRMISRVGVRLAVRHGGGGHSTVSVESLHMPSGLDRFRRLPVPRQQLVESIDWVSIDHALEDVTQISIGFDIAHLARFNERAQRRPSGSALVRTREEMVFSSESNGTDRAFDRIGIELDATILQKSRETVPARQRISDRIGESAAARHLAELLLEPDLHLFDQRLGECPPFRHPHRRGLAADALLDGVE